MQAVRAMPGVISAGVVSQLPFSADYGSGPYFVEGDPRGSGASEMGKILIADQDYFRSMQMPLLRGRAFALTDDANSLPVAIIDQALARRSFGDRDPLGQRIGTANVDGTIAWRTVVGVVQSIKTQTLAAQANAPSYYFPLAQEPASIFRVVIKTHVSAATTAQALRERVAGLDPEQPVWEVMSMHERLDRSLSDKRTPAGLLLLFAGVALLLSAIGVYAVLAHSVGQQTAEIGVRMSLGATRQAIARWVLAAGVRWVLAGLLIGSLLAALLAYRLREHLFEVSPLDFPSLLGVLLILTPIALLACWLPARRAAHISPMEALRHN
jgi:predicted permease